MIFLLMGCLATWQTKKIQSWDDGDDLTNIHSMIIESKHGYHRELAIKQLTYIPTEEWSIETTKTLIECVDNSLEHSYIRAQCAGVLALSPSSTKEAVDSIIAAMEECDDEARYWMLVALENYADLSSLARGQIAESQYDPDLFISSEAKRWLEENQ